MAGFDAGIVGKLECYAAAQHIQRGSPQWSQLLMGYQRNPRDFTELLDRELARIRDDNNNDNGGST